MKSRIASRINLAIRVAVAYAAENVQLPVGAGRFHFLSERCAIASRNTRSSSPIILSTFAALGPANAFQDPTGRRQQIDLFEVLDSADVLLPLFRPQPQLAGALQGFARWGRW